MKIDSSFNLFSAGFDFGTEEKVQTPHVSGPEIESSEFTLNTITITPKKPALQDFGEKIGGARKDLWAIRGLLVSDLDDMTDLEKDQYVKKGNVWKKPDYEALVSSGLQKEVVFFMKTMRDALPSAPSAPRYWDDSEKEDLRRRYITLVADLRDAVMSCKDMKDVAAIANWPVDHGYLPRMSCYCLAVTKKGEQLFNRKLVRAFPDAEPHNCFVEYNRRVKKTQFCYSEREKIIAEYGIFIFRPESVRIGKNCLQAKSWEGSFFYYISEEAAKKAEKLEDGKWFAVGHEELVAINCISREEAEDAAVKHHYALSDAFASKPVSKSARKTAMKLSPLAAVKSSGFDYRKDKDATTDGFMKVLGFRAGEFGNWVNETERQENLNFAYDSFMNIAKALSLDPKQVTFNGELAIAFGARGHGNALAHYEPGRVVINLTRMKGAGSLGHEWCHFFDDMINRGYNGSGRTANFMSEASAYQQLDSFKAVMKAIKKKTLSHADTVQYVSADLAKREQYVRDFVTSSLLCHGVDEDKQHAVLTIVEKIIKACELDGSALPAKAISEFREFYEKELPGKSPAAMLSRMSYHKGILFMGAEAVRKAMADENYTVEVTTDYFSDAVAFDAIYSRSGFGYWHSDVELFARAGACWLKDRLTEMGIRDDYLCGHADTGCSISKGKEIYAYPRGEERKAINAAFDALIAEVKQKKLFEKRG